MADNTNKDAYRGVMRQERQTTGIKGQDHRVAGDPNRVAHVTRGDYINYYDDLGFSTTQEHADILKQEEANFQSSAADYQNQLDTNTSDLNTKYQTKLGKIDEAYASLDPVKILDNLWKETSSDFININVVKQDGKGGYITEGTYHLPRATAEDLAKKKGVATNWDDEGNFYVDVKTAKGGRYIGQELHEGFSQGEKDIYQQWYTQAAPLVMSQVREGKGVLAGANAQLNEQYTTSAGSLGQSQITLDSAKNQRTMDWEKLRNDYQKKKETIKSILSNTTVKEA